MRYIYIVGVYIAVNVVKTIRLEPLSHPGGGWSGGFGFFFGGTTLGTCAFLVVFLVVPVVV